MEDAQREAPPPRLFSGAESFKTFHPLLSYTAGLAHAVLEAAGLEKWRLERLLLMGSLQPPSHTLSKLANFAMVDMEVGRRSLKLSSCLPAKNESLILIQLFPLSFNHHISLKKVGF